MSGIIKITIIGKPTAESIYQYKKMESRKLPSPPPVPIYENKPPEYKSNNGDSFWDKIARPHCPTCGYRLTRWSNAVNDEVYDRVDACPYCQQRLIWVYSK